MVAKFFSFLRRVQGDTEALTPSLLLNGHFGRGGSLPENKESEPWK